MLVSLHIVFITLEFSAGTFSGNGVLAQDQVRSLTALGHHVFVISGRPLQHVAKPDPQGAQHLIEVDILSMSYRFLRDGVRFQYRLGEDWIVRVHVVLGVDWSSLPVYQRIKESRVQWPPFVWSAYRIFTRMASDPATRQFFQRMEAECVAQAAISTVLSKSDYRFVLEHLASEQKRKRLFVLFPHIRQDIVDILPFTSHTLALDSPFQDRAAACVANYDRVSIGSLRQQRPYFTCCVRLSPEKEPHRFVEIVEEMQSQGLFERFNLKPLMCSSSTTDYAQGLKDRLLDAVPDAVVVERFLDPIEIAHLYSRTRLNIHPCLYDAYGMTIVEAASQEAPSVVDMGGGVGASDFLRTVYSEILEIDYTQELSIVVSQIDRLLESDGRLQEVGRAASKRVRQYTALQNAQQLQQLLTDAAKDRRS